MPGAWDIQPGGSADVIVAVLDSGVTTGSGSLTFPIWTGSGFEAVTMAYAANPDLASSRLVDPRDFAFLDPSGPVVDMDGHGTHVSSTIGEDTNNALLLAGLAYRARIMPVKVCVGYWEIMIARAQVGIPGFISASSGGCAIADIADGIRYAADRGAKVINLSLGGTSEQATVRDALNYAVTKGTFSAIAMGNNYESGNATNYPARYAQEIIGVMSIGAIGKTQGKSYYSATGAHIEIAAPGGDSRIGGSPDFGYVWQSTLIPTDQAPSILRPRFDRYDGVGYQGTSMATPHVAGLAALIAAQSPGITPAEIEFAIKATARDMGATGKDNDFGFGLIEPRAVLYGWGIRK
jgi:serine protease